MHWKEHFCGRRERFAAAVAGLGLLDADKTGVKVAGEDRRLVAIKAGCEVARRCGGPVAF